jgi:hypothetical protein
MYWNFVVTDGVIKNQLLESNSCWLGTKSSNKPRDCQQDDVQHTANHCKTSLIHVTKTMGKHLKSLQEAIMYN